MKRLHWPGALALLGTLVGVASSPLVLNLVPSHWAAVIVAATSLVQAVTKAVHQPHVEPK